MLYFSIFSEKLNYISPIHTFANIPALLLKNTLRFLMRARIFTKVWIRDINTLWTFSKIILIERLAWTKKCMFRSNLHLMVLIEKPQYSISHTIINSYHSISSLAIIRKGIETFVNISTRCFTVSNQSIKTRFTSASITSSSVSTDSAGPFCDLLILL